MSEENDKPKNDKNSVAVVNNAIPVLENNESLENNENIIPSNPVPNKENITNVVANDGKYQDVMPSTRKNMVTKATEFLINEQIRSTPFERKVNFLRSRGLTDYEIQLSLQKAATICNNNQNFTAQAYNIPLPSPPNYNYSKTSDVSGESQSWLRKLVGPVAFGTTAVYIGYQIYKKYIENWLFGVQMSPVEKRLEVVELLVQKCVTLVEEKNNTSECSSEQINRQKELDQIRAELKSIKSLLINRFQFPPAPTSTSIPQWQLIKIAKPQTEPQNKVNGTDTSNSSITSILNGSNSISVVPHEIDSSVYDAIKNKCPLNNTTSNGITLPSNSDQHTTNNNNTVHQNNDDKINMAVNEIEKQ